MKNSLLTKTLAIGLCLSVMSACSLSPNTLTTNTQSSINKPNVLVIMFDDMRFDTFSYRGGPVNTPNIDELASQSIRFDNAMTSTGLCSPSRAAFFTGRWGHKNGLDDNVELYHSRLSELNPNQDGLIQQAADAGYYVGYVGKWHLGHNGPALRGAEFTAGKEHNKETAKARPYTPYGRPELIDNYKQGKLDKNNEKVEYYKTLPGHYEQSRTAIKVRDGKQMLRQAAKQNKPFFGVISFHQPHPPYKVPEPYASMFDPNSIELPSNHGVKPLFKPMTQNGVYWPWHDTSHMTELDWRKARAFYYGAIAMVDHAVGQIIETAKEEGLYDDLHIVLLGDQGSMIGEHNLYDKGPYAYDELMRMPLIVRKPDQASKSIQRQVSMLDLAPTMSEWMGLIPDGDIDGVSLNPLINHGDSVWQGKQDKALYAYEWYNGAWFGIRAIRTPEWKYVWYPGDSRDELYNLKQDPIELNNLYNQPEYKAQQIKMLKLLEQELIRVEDPSIHKFRNQMAEYL